MTRIAIDMDDVLADTSARYLELYNAEFQNEAVSIEQLNGTSLIEAIPEHRRSRIESYLSAPEFFDGLNPRPDALRVVAALSRKYEVIIATAAMHYPDCFSTRYAWLRRHLTFIPPRQIVFCGDKGVVRADYLIDDNPWQLERFQGVGILFSAPHNASATGFTRVDSWVDVDQLFAMDSIARNAG
jgi:5'(3')-deoxyribonucleotidase